MSRRALIAALIAIPLAAGAAPRAVRAQTGPQPELPRERLVIVTHDGQQHVFSVEVATAMSQQVVGLMFRPSVSEDGGMLFDWGAPRPSQMWMRNTIVSLDMLFINQDGTVRSIAEHTVPQSLAVIDSRGPVRATLEVAAGTAERLDIRVGDHVLHPIFGTGS